jgi:hypothetical protein
MALWRDPLDELIADLERALPPDARRGILQIPRFEDDHAQYLEKNFRHSIHSALVKAGRVLDVSGFQGCSKRGRQPRKALARIEREVERQGLRG